jgi:hypothetical protein
MQILNTSAETKTGGYIAAVCKSLIEDLKIRCPMTNVAGFVMDIASANRSAMELRDADGAVSPMMNLQCAAHMLSLLMKDLSKRFPWVQETFRRVLYISNTVNSSEKFRYLVQKQCEKDNVPYSTIPAHCDTRFGSHYIVANAVESRLHTLVAWAGSADFLDLVARRNESAVEIHKLLLGQYADDDGLVKRLPVLKKLFSPIMQFLTQVEADKASLSRMRAIVRQLEAHADQFTAMYPDLCSGAIQKEKQPGRAVTLKETFHSLLRVFYYKPAITAAFLLDPINFRVSQEGRIELPFEVLSIAEENEAVSDIERISGGDIDAVTTELSTLKLNGIKEGAPDGLSKLNLKVVKDCMLVTEQDMQDGTVKRSCSAQETRLNCWLKVLNAQFPVLGKVAAVYSTMHSTSCASERNLSVFGRLYDKFRGRLQLKRGEKMVFLAVNDRIVRRQLDTSTEEVLFNDSDIEEDVQDEGMVGSLIESLLAGTDC